MPDNYIFVASEPSYEYSLDHSLIVASQSIHSSLDVRLMRLLSYAHDINQHTLVYANSLMASYAFFVSVSIMLDAHASARLNAREKFRQELSNMTMPSGTLSTANGLVFATPARHDTEIVRRCTTSRASPQPPSNYVDVTGDGPRPDQRGEQLPYLVRQ